MKNIVSFIPALLLVLISCELTVDPVIPDHVVLPEHAAPNFSLPPQIAPGQVPEGLMLWNKLDNVDEFGVVSSSFGPDGNISGQVNFNNDVMFDKGVSPNDGSGLAGVNFDSKLLDPESGTIEMWSIFFENPTPYRYGVYGFVNTAYQYAVTPIRLYWHNTEYMIAHVYFGEDNQGRVTIIQDGFKPLLNTPVHIAIIWDRNRIDGTKDFIRIYVDGELFAVSDQNHWGKDNNGQFRIGSGWDRDYSVDRYAVDNVQIYDYAKTDFSQRFREAPSKK